MDNSYKAAKLEILLLEGIPSGLRYIDLKNWVGRAFVCPRTSLPDLLKRKELDKAGVYFLYGQSDTAELPSFYIGEADVLKNRLPQHAKKEFWTDVIVFISQDELLDKAAVRYLESNLVKGLLEDKLCNLENGNIPEIVNISEADQAVLNEYLEKIKFILLVLGYKVFRYKRTVDTKKDDLLELKSSEYKAYGTHTDEGFVVNKGSQANINDIDKLSQKFKQLRKELIQKGVLENQNGILIFTQDYLFSSPSYASSMILGYSTNGRILWQNRNGKTLKEMQDSKIESH